MKTEKNLMSYCPNVLTTKNPSQPCLEFPPCSNSLVKEPTAQITRYSRYPDFVRTEIRSLGKGRRKVAFTLAEVLITLGIIGVVAAMTMPSIIEKHQKQVTINKLKKAYSVMNEILVRAQEEHGPIETWAPIEFKGHSEFKKKYLDPYAQDLTYVTYIEDVMNISNTTYATGANNPNGIRNKLWKDNISCLKDGICYWTYTMYVDEKMAVETHGMPGAYVYSAMIIVDINGPKKPNRLGRDIFHFSLKTPITNKPHTKLASSLLKGTSTQTTREKIIQKDCNKSLTEGWSGSACFSLILHDGWQIKDDYPW